MSVTTLGDRVFQGIFTMILDGELPLGGVVNEAALAQRFGVSRGPVREAVQRLQGLRLVEKESFLRARVISPTKGDLVEIFQLREVVEGLACRLAAGRVPRDAISEMIGRLEADRDDRRAGRRSAPRIDLHQEIARSSGNRRVVQVVCEDLYYPMQLFRVRARLAPGRQDRAFEEHWQILRAIATGDGELAESLMRRHIGSATAALQATLESEGAEPARASVA